MYLVLNTIIDIYFGKCNVIKRVGIKWLIFLFRLVGKFDCF